MRQRTRTRQRTTDKLPIRPTAVSQILRPISPTVGLLRSEKTAREFGGDQCTDLAAALTYYAVLSIFPALVVVVSLLGVSGEGKPLVDRP